MYVATCCIWGQYTLTWYVNKQEDFLLLLRGSAQRYTCTQPLPLPPRYPLPPPTPLANSVIPFSTINHMATPNGIDLIWCAQWTKVSGEGILLVCEHVKDITSCAPEVITCARGKCSVYFFPPCPFQGLHIICMYIFRYHSNLTDHIEPLGCIISFNRSLIGTDAVISRLRFMSGILEQFSGNCFKYMYSVLQPRTRCQRWIIKGYRMSSRNNYGMAESLAEVLIRQ